MGAGWSGEPPPDALKRRRAVLVLGIAVLAAALAMELATGAVPRLATGPNTPGLRGGAALGSASKSIADLLAAVEPAPARGTGAALPGPDHLREGGER